MDGDHATSPGCRRAAWARSASPSRRRKPGRVWAHRRGRGGRGLPLRRRRRDLGAAQRGARPAPARRGTTCTSSPTRRTPRPSGCSTSRRWKSTDGGKTFDADPDAARRQPRSLDRPAQPAAHDRGQRRRRERLASTAARPGRRIYNQPTARVLSRHDRQPDAVSRLRRAAGQHDDQRAQPLQSRRDHAAPTGTRSAAARAATSPSDPDDPNIVFAGSYGGVHDPLRPPHRAGAQISPSGRRSRPAAAAKDVKYRFQWTFPIVLSPHDPECIYITGNHVLPLDRRGAAAGR